MYSEMSGYVHFSQKHIESSRKEAANENEDGTKNVYYNTSAESLVISDEKYADLIEKFLFISEYLTTHFRNVVKGKSLKKQESNLPQKLLPE